MFNIITYATIVFLIILFSISTIALFVLISVCHKNSKRIEYLEKRSGTKPCVYKYMAIEGVNKDLKSAMKYDQASCFDIESAERKTIPAGGNALIETGLIFDLPENRELQIRPRSGWSYDTMGLVVFGTGDSDYRGTYKVNVFNLSKGDITIEVGDRIAQGFIGEKVFIASRDTLVRVDSVDEFDIPFTERGKKGFGSTGIAKK